MVPLCSGQMGSRVAPRWGDEYGFLLDIANLSVCPDRLDAMPHLFGMMLGSLYDRESFTSTIPMITASGAPAVGREHA